MLSLTTAQQTAIDTDHHVIEWLFEVTDNLSTLHRWATTDTTFGGNSYSGRVIGESFRGITERRRCFEDGRIVPTEVQFAVECVSSDLDPSNFDSSTVVVRLVVNGEEIRNWKFATVSVGKAYQSLQFHCTDLLSKILSMGDYPTTQLVRNIWPDKNVVMDNYVVPIPFGTVYIPVRPVWCTPTGQSEGRYYLLGPDSQDYTIMKIRSPRDYPNTSEWEDGFYQYTADGYKVLLAQIADTDMDGTADAQGLWWTSRLLDAPLKFARHDLAGTTNPGDVISWILQDMGIDSGDIDISQKTQFDTWDLRWDGALWRQENRASLLARLLVQCGSTLDPQEQITLRPLSKSSVATLTSSDVLGQSFEFTPASAKPDHDSGYIAWQGADVVIDEDPTFEKSAGVWATYWNRDASTGAPTPPDMDTAYGRSGYGVRITAPGSGEYAYIYGKQPCPASANDNVFITADIKSNTLTDGIVRLIAWYYDSTGTHLGSVKTNIESSLVDGSWVNVRTTVTLPNDSSIASTRIGVIVNNSTSGSIDIDNVFGLLASSTDRVDEPWDQFNQLIIPVDSSTDKPSSVQYLMDFVHDQDAALRLGQMALQRTLGVNGYARLVTSFKHLALQPYDVITISGTNYWAGDYDIDEVRISKNGAIELRLRQYDHALKDWSDISPTSRTLEDPSSQITWEVVTSGPDTSPDSGDSPNQLKGRISIGDDSTTRIIIDPSHPQASGPLIELIEAAQERVQIGELSTNNYGIVIKNATGQTVVLIDSSQAKLAGWNLTDTEIKNDKIDIDSGNELITISDGSITRVYLGQISAGNYGVLMKDASGNNILLIDSSQAELAGWSLDGNRIYKSNIEINASTPSVKVWNGTNYVELSPSGLVGYDATLGQTLKIPTDGSKPEFASGIIKEAIYQLYISGVIKTSDDPASTGGVLINNAGIKGYDNTGTLKFKLDATTGTIWAEDAEISGTVTVGSGSSVPWDYVTGSNKPEDNANLVTSTSELDDDANLSGVEYGRYDGESQATSPENITILVDNNQAANGWYKVASCRLTTAYDSWNFTGFLEHGASNNRIRKQHRISFSVETGSTTDSAVESLYVSTPSSSDFNSIFRLMRVDNGDSTFTWTIYIKLGYWTSARLRGVFQIGGHTPLSETWYDDYQNSADSLGSSYSPPGTQISPTFNYEPGATVGAPSGTSVAGTPADDVATAVANFNASNDRNSDPISAPTVATDGTAVDHSIRTDGSADISFEWSWSGDEGDIDGFLVYVRQSASSAAYTIGTTPAEETIYVLPASKRAFILYGVPADLYYTFGVQAYRKVDKDIASSGIIASSIAQPSATGENPYQPSSSVAFQGDVTGTIDGLPASNVNVWDHITGTGKPEDNATVGATWSDNITGQPSDPELLNAAQFIEPCEDTGAWNANTNSTVAIDTDSFSGDYSIKITWNGTADPASSGTTGGAYIAIPERIALGFGGKRIKVTIYAKQPSTGASSEFAVAYSTNDVGNSGWNKFTPTTSWAPYTFYYDVPEPSAGGVDYLGVWADTSHSGLSILIDNIVIEATVKESELDALDLTNAPAEAGATNDATWRHPSDTTKIDGGKIYAGSQVSIGSSGFLRINPSKTYGDTNPGIWMGDDGGTYKFELRNSNGHYIKDTGTEIEHVGSIRDLTPWESTQTADFTASSNKKYPIDTSGGEVTMTLPASPSVNDKISWLDLTRSFDANSFLIDPNGQPFEGETYATGDLVEINVEGLNGTIEYTGTTYGWKILAVA